ERRRGRAPSGRQSLGKMGLLSDSLVAPMAAGCYNLVRHFGNNSILKDVNSMKIPGGFDMNAMMKQAQQMQEKMGREMKETVVDASAGGGAVAVKMRGDFEVVELTISPDLVKDGDVEMIQDLTVAALNEARRKVEEALKGKLGGMLPPGMV